MQPNSNRPQDWPGQDTSSPQPQNPSGSNPPEFGRPDAPTTEFNQDMHVDPPANPGFSTPVSRPAYEELPPARPDYPGLSGTPVMPQRKYGPKRGKLVLGVTAGLMVLLAVAAGALFAYYNNPTKVVGDALSNSMWAETAHVKGNAKISGESSGTKTDFTLDYDVKVVDQQMLADLSMAVDVPPVSVDLSGGLAMDKEENLYFKINDAKQIFQNLSGIGAQLDSPMMKPINDALDTVDSKWVKVSREELSSTLEEDQAMRECTTQLTNDLRNDSKFRNELSDLYKQHTFIIAESRDSDSFNTLHYKLTLDKQKTRDFAVAFEQSELFKRLKACDDTFDIDEQAIADSIDDINKMNIEVWIDRWSHQFEKIAVNGGDEQSQFALTMDTVYGEPVTVDIPHDATPFGEVTAKFNEAFGGMFGGALEPVQLEPQSTDDLLTSSNSGNPVLGDQTARLLPWVN